MPTKRPTGNAQLTVISGNSVPKSDRVLDLSDLMEEVEAATVMNVRTAKSGFSRVLRMAREGHPQLVAPEGEEPVLLISRRALEEAIKGRPSALLAFCADMHPVDVDLDVREGAGELFRFDAEPVTAKTQSQL